MAACNIHCRRHFVIKKATTVQSLHWIPPAYHARFLWYHSFAAATLNHWYSATIHAGHLMCHYTDHVETFLHANARESRLTFSRKLTKWLLILLTQYWIQFISSLKQRPVADAIAYTPQSKLLVGCSIQCRSINLFANQCVLHQTGHMQRIHITLIHYD